MKTKEFILPDKVISIQGDEPHPDNKGWKNFIRKDCELRDEHDGVQFFGSSNCNYIVFPCGALVQNFGYHGKDLMNQIRENDKESILIKIQGIHAEIKAVLEKYQLT